MTVTLTKTPTAHPAAPLGSATLSAVVRAIGDLHDRIASWRRNRETVAALRRLTPAQLDDIGLTLADVDRVERGGRL